MRLVWLLLLQEMLECLCKLLTTTGKKLEMLADVSEDKAARKELRSKFRVIERLSDNTEKLNPRTRFLLKDLLDLRKNEYVPRRALETAKTISQVRPRPPPPQQKQQRRHRQAPQVEEHRGKAVAGALALSP